MVCQYLITNERLLVSAAQCLLQQDVIILKYLIVWQINNYFVLLNNLMVFFSN